MLRKWYHKLFEKKKIQPVRLRPRLRLCLEALEDRVVPASFLVTSTADDGSAGTLRAAIAQANASSDATNTISFNLGAGAHTIALSSWRNPLTLNNSHSTTILGTGADQLFISGNYRTGVFSIASGTTAELDNLTIENGGNSTYGGGIYNSGNLTINNSTLSSNAAIVYGGGIYSASGGTVTINNCTLSGNTAGGTYYTGSGGGIYSQWSILKISNSTIAGNTASSGGGIYIFYGTATISNSTIAGNTAGYGGGIFNYGYSTTISNSTIAGNTASFGGGINNYSGTINLGNSIVAANTSNASSRDVEGFFTSLGHNLIGSSTGSAGFSNGVNGDLVGNNASLLDPKLGPLADNGGPTQTMALLDGSPAINAGSNALIPIDPSTGQPFTTDQRGAPRIVGATVDIGAYESDVAQSSQTITFNPLPNLTFGDADFPLTATTSSGLPVSYTASGNVTLYQDMSGNWFAHITGAGTATITASQAGNSAYFAAPNVSQTFTIAQATPTVSVADAGGTYNGNAFPATATALGVDGQTLVSGSFSYAYYVGSSASGTSSATAPVNAGTYTVVATFSSSDNNYTGGNAQLTFTIHAALPTVNVTDAGGIYNGQPFPATATVAGVVAGVDSTPAASLEGVTPTLSYYAGSSATGTAFAAAPAQAGTYTVVASFAGSTDYTAASASTTFTIAQATTGFSNLTMQQIITGTNSITLSGQLTSNTIVPVGQSVSITLNGLTQSATVAADGSFSVSFATGTLGVGAYTISYSYVGDNNFTAASASGNLTVDYGSQLLFNNSKPVHAGAVLPVKVELTDASGADISSPNITVTAVGLTDANGNSVPLNAAGNANPNDLFRYDPSLGGYIFNLSTKGLAAGTYTLYYTAGNDPTLHSLTFVVA